MYNFIYILLLFLSFDSQCQSMNNYRGYQVLEIKNGTSYTYSQLQEDYNVDIWGHGRMMVAKDSVNSVKGFLESEKISFTIPIEDVAQHLEDYEKRNRKPTGETCTDGSCSKPFYKDWMTFEQIEWHLMDLKEKYNSKIEVRSIGKSYEDRDIWLVHIKASCQTCSNTPAVWIEAGIHAREWIAVSTGIHTANYILSNPKLYRNVEYFIVPLANPDGYIFSYTTERYWRKNRRIGSNDNCIGVDLNRNWDFQFGVGASNHPCSDVYKGTKAFSEPETIALSNEMKSIKNMKLSIAVHSFGQYLLHPYGHTTEAAPNEKEMVKLANSFVKPIAKKYKIMYAIESSSEFSSAFISGTTDDWAYGVLNVPYSYTLECPDKKGFVVPKKKIKKYVKSSLQGMKAMFKRIAKIYKE